MTTKTVINQTTYSAVYDRARAEALIAKTVIEGAGDTFDPARLVGVKYTILMGESADEPGKQFIQSVAAEVTVDNSPAEPAT
jgi:hypothetical protein